MSLHLHRRDEGDPVEEKKETPAEPQKKYSVTVYICLLFAVMLIIVLLSYLAQARNNNQTILSLREQHDAVTSEAFDNIEKLQDKNMELMEENEKLADEKEEMETAVSAAAEETKVSEEKVKSLEEQNLTLKKIADLEKALVERNTAAAEQLLGELDQTKDDVTKEYSSVIEAARKQLTEVPTEVPTEE